MNIQKSLLGFLIFSHNIFSQNNGLTAWLKSPAISNHYMQCCDGFKTKTAAFVKKHPYVCGGVAAALSAYSIYCIGDYLRDWRNPMPVLTEGSYGKNEKKFNRALGFLRKQKHFRQAIERSSAQQRVKIWRKYKHKFDFETAMQFLRYTENQDFESYYNYFNNHDVITPEAGLQWFLAKQNTFTFVHPDKIFFFLERVDSLSQQRRSEILDVCLIRSVETSHWHLLAPLVDAGARFPEDEITARPLLLRIISHFGPQSVIALIFNSRISLERRSILANWVFLLASECRKGELAALLIETCDAQNIQLDFAASIFHAVSKIEDSYSRQYFGQKAIAFITSLIERNRVDINAKNREGKTVLHVAFDNKLYHVVDYLTELPTIDINAQDAEGNTILHRAFQRRMQPFIRVLVERFRANPSVQNNAGDTVLHMACRDNLNQLVEYLIYTTNVDYNLANTQGQTALHLACQQENVVMAQLLLEQPNINVVHRNDQNRSPLGVLRLQQEALHSLILLRSNYTQRLPVKFSFAQAVIAMMLINKMRQIAYKKLNATNDNTLSRLGEQSDCPICTSQVEHPKTTLCCLGAKYCADCIGDLLEQPNSKCPICREALFKEMITDVPCLERIEADAKIEQAGISVSRVTTEREQLLLNELAQHALTLSLLS